ncbi:regulator of G-protein signaling 11-like isoform X2 [Littorina saxatilis]|uniref:regulator of G-protein signaling 11-like isoform X2 n=1 Tax=Littorina saxatilis TaxID=31220 RepID=UPI0038B5BC83
MEFTLTENKMERLIQEMQHAQKGVPVKSQKSFLSIIPAVFTGEDFIMWLKRRLSVSEEEAQHLACLFCQYGYIFPVTDTKVLTVKDDNSLYRFQNPHYWPSQDLDPDNVAYAIHLTKRSMRNKQKHGLEEHEQMALNKLQKMLCDKKEFIECQARDQVRLAKERKRTDKAVLDSQERAFWRIHRPAPGQVKCIEEGPKRNFRCSQIESRKLRKDILIKKVQVLRKSYAMQGVKTSQALEIYITRAEKYHDYDPMFIPVYPSNPWISDETNFWDLCDDHTDILTERRVKMWALSFRDMLADRLGQGEFENFLKKEYSQENLRFWRACEDLKFAPVSRVPTHIDTIYREFLTAGSLHEVNIDGKTSQLVLQNIRDGKEGKPSRFTFAAAQEHIFLLMKKDSYARFLRSEHYKNLLSNALQPEGKKKFFNFGSRKKNMLTPSPKPKRRGSSNSGDGDGETTVGPVAHHSYSTGNLQELDDKAVVLRRDVNSSDSSLTRCDTSPNLSRRHERASSTRGESPRKNRQLQLEVPKHMSLNLDGSARGEQSSCLALSVPSKTNVVAPWEGSE